MRHEKPFRMKLRGSGHNENKMFSSPMQTQLSKLAANTLLEFKVGFNNGELSSKHDVRNLIKVIEDKYFHKLVNDKHSCLKSIRIGWNLPRCVLVPMLQEVIPMLLKPPAKVTHLQLALDCWVPESTLKRLVSWHTLESLELGGVRIQTRAVSDVRHNRGKFRLTPTERHSERFQPPLSSNLDDNIIGIIPYISESIESLKLSENDLQSHYIPLLCDNVRKKRNIKSLSLRHNRDLAGCWEELLDLPQLKSLDLSICDMDESDGYMIVKALKEQNHCLKKLSVAGNYRMAGAIPAMVEAAGTTALVAFDCSFCEVNNRFQRQVFHILATVPNCTLRSLRMQGTRIKNVDGILECIHKNQSLENLVLDHPREPAPLAANDISTMMEAVQSNYFLQDIRFDVEKRNKDIMQGAQFWLDLNRCGRSLLLQENDTGKSWSNVIYSAAQMNDKDIVFWLLKHGANQF
jgi:hypothetical protein